MRQKHAGCVARTLLIMRQLLLCLKFLIEIESQLRSGFAAMQFRAILPQSIPLSRLPTGTEARVTRLEGKAETCQRLREIGFCESAVICRVGGEHSMVCQVCGTRVALNRLLAEIIHVEPLAVAR
jgi:ferrous iron transport protein A